MTDVVTGNCTEQSGKLGKGRTKSGGNEREVREERGERWISLDF